MAKTPNAEHTCDVCGGRRDYICERCLRCENCCAAHDKKRELPEQHNGRWLWSVQSMKGVQLRSLVIAGHGKGDFEGKKP
jgi:hypothetical protein